MKNWNKRTFLYINGDLHRKIQTLRAKDIFVAQNTQTGVIKTFSYRVVRDTHQTAYNTNEVGALLNRSARHVRELIRIGVVEPQQQSKNQFKGVQETHLDTKVVTTNTGRCEYYFTPDDIHVLRDHLAESNRKETPSKAELTSMLDQSVVLYMRDKDGSFVPTFLAKNY